MRTFGRLLSFLRPFFWEVLLSIFLSVAAITTGIGMLGTSAFLIASAALHPSIAELQVAIVGVRFFGISRGVFRYLERLVSHSVNLRLLSNLRGWFYRQVDASTPAELFSLKSGDLLSRILGDVETLENFYVRVVSPFVTALIIGVGVSLFIGSYSEGLGWIICAGLFTNGILIPTEAILLTRNTARISTISRSNLTSRMIETIQGLEDLQSAGASNRWFDLISAESRTVGKIQNKLFTLNGINSGLSLAVLNLTIISLVLLSIPQVSSGSMSGITLAVITLVGMASFEATNTLPTAAQNLTASIESAKRIFQLAGNDQAKTLLIPPVSGSLSREVRMEKVSFSYPGENTFKLQGLDLALYPGKKIALVGPSGAGKTSLVNLVLKFWEPKSGNILLDDQNISNLDSNFVRNHFSVISQSTYIFSQTLKENLLLAKPDATDDELRIAIEGAKLSELVITLPNGLDSWVGEQGKHLSGGERQRLAIARVFLQNRPFLILDEPTINLDPITARSIMDQIFSLFANKSILLITHEFNDLYRMDEILFLQKGSVIARGSNEMLLKSSMEYQKLANLGRII